MELVFSDAKNGEKTCASGGKYLHSSYNPTREAEQYVAHLSAPFNPSAVIIIEPALSYCAPFLRKRFPDATLCAVRLSNDFSASDGAWDSVFAADGALADILFCRLGEETLCAALFFAWQPSEQVFSAETTDVWQAIKAAVLKSRDVLATRAYFAKRWIKNTVRFCARVQNTALIQKGSADIIVAASGPSLRTSLPFLAQHRASFFLLAVSSALLPLLHAGITPDVVLSTDGGFWAKKHLALSGYDVSAVPFALAAEGACPAAVLKTNVIVPLYYEDGIEKDFFTACTIPAMSATRNGTVSGTAIALALALTSGNVYACGLDLAPAQGFQHTGPNALEAQDEAKDNRLRTKQTRIAASACNGGALTVYRDWFAAESERLAKRVFRLSDSYPFVHTLGKMRDVDWDFFTREHASAPSTTIFPRIVRTELPHTDRARVIRTCADACFAGDAYDAELCPVESLMQKRALTEHERAAYTETIARKKAQFVRELEQRI